MSVVHLPEVLRCPVCGSRPDIDQCLPWPRDAGPPAWYANCYSLHPDEHCIGVNGDSQREVINLWNEAAATPPKGSGSHQQQMDKGK